MKVVATLHPSYILRGQWARLHLLVDDLEKAQSEAWTSEVRIREHSYQAYPSGADDARPFLRLGDPRPLTLDIETTGIEDDAGIVCCGVGREKGKAICLPWREPFLSMLRPALLDPASEKVAHNAAFDFPRLSRALGLRKIAGKWFDTLLAHSVCYSDLAHNLEEVASTSYDQYPWKERTQDSLQVYNCKDVDATQHAKDWLETKMDAFGVREVFEKEVMPCVPVVMKIHENGVRVNRERMLGLAAELGAVAKAAEDVIASLVMSLPSRRAARDVLLREADILDETALPLLKPGTKREGMKLQTQARKKREAAEAMGRVNLGSPKQLAELLYGDLGMPRKHNERGTETTDDDALVELVRTQQGKRGAEILEPLRAWREVSKLVATNLSYEEEVLKPHVLLHGAGTGRWSMRDPNLQNTPIRNEAWGWRIRSIYEPRQRGFLFTKADYSQIERRIQAELAGDEDLKRAFREGLDAHTETAKKVYAVIEKCAPEAVEVTKQKRYLTKRTVYLESYGGGFLKLQRTLAAEGLFVSVEEAKELLSAIRMAQPAITAWHLRLLAQVEKEHVLRTPFGRIRWFLGPAFGDAINFLPQGTTASIIARAAAEMDAIFETEAPECYVALQVHDELVVAHPPERTEWVQGMMKEVMEKRHPQMGGWWCPVEGKTGTNLAFREA